MYMRVQDLVDRYTLPRQIAEVQGSSMDIRQAQLLSQLNAPPRRNVQPPWLRPWSAPQMLRRRRRRDEGLNGLGSTSNVVTKEYLLKVREYEQAGYGKYAAQAAAEADITSKGRSIYASDNAARQDEDDFAARLERAQSDLEEDDFDKRLAAVSKRDGGEDDFYQRLEAAQSRRIAATRTRGEPRGTVLRPTVRRPTAPAPPAPRPTVRSPGAGPLDTSSRDQALLKLSTQAGSTRIGNDQVSLTVGDRGRGIDTGTILAGVAAVGALVAVGMAIRS